MSEFEAEQRPLFIIEIFLEDGKQILVAERDVEVTEFVPGYGVSTGQ